MYGTFHLYTGDNGRFECVLTVGYVAVTESTEENMDRWIPEPFPLEEDNKPSDHPPNIQLLYDSFHRE